MARGVQYSGNEALSVAGTAVGFTAATIANKNHAFITVEGATVRFFVNGQTATASLGAELLPGDILELDSADQLSSFSAISKDGGTATLRCQFGI